MIISIVFSKKDTYETIKKNFKENNFCIQKT